MPARTISRRSVEAPGFVRFCSGRSNAVLTKSRSVSKSVRRYVLSRSQRAMCVAKPPASRRNRTPERFQRRKDFAVSRRRGEVHGLPHILAGFLRAVPPVGDVSQRGEHGRTVVAARAGHVQPLAEHAVGVVELTAFGQRFAELPTENEHGAHRIVELTPKELAARQVETLA